MTSLRRVMSDSPSEAYVLTADACSDWHIVDRSGPSRLIASQGEPRVTGDAFAAMEASAAQRQAYSPQRTFRAVAREQLGAYGFEVV